QPVANGNPHARLIRVLCHESTRRISRDVLRPGTSDWNRPHSRDYSGEVPDLRTPREKLVDSWQSCFVPGCPGFQGGPASGGIVRRGRVRVNSESAGGARIATTRRMAR